MFAGNYHLSSSTSIAPSFGHRGVVDTSMTQTVSPSKFESGIRTERAEEVVTARGDCPKP